ncbi:B-cell receptor CD22-like isoform X1 [Xiphophorus hellerii]|uniref:B-cell receptor CD22-like isoform X1 n=1 Tax=Xiphophorus hellerii TaxID=8084 RepID=UPI0013B4088C|nr:B-cell receptor CD22-like isoform X1 [Xiphophorus hellerii]
MQTQYVWVNLTVIVAPGFAGSVVACGHDVGLFITAPTPMEALNGSCLHIPCNFTAKSDGSSSSGEPVGVWMKSDPSFSTFPQNVIFNSSDTTNVYPMTITGNLKEKNCTTLFSGVNQSHADTYYFRIEHGQFKASAICHALEIKIKDSPWSPSINLPSDLKEHQSVTITCSAFTPCPQSPPELTWNLQQDSLRQTEKNTEGIFTTKIQKNITLSDTHDGYNISCSATYPVIGGNKTAETEVTLSVSYAPKDTSASISPSALVSAGSWVELSCSSRAKPPPSFTWFRNNKQGAMNVSMEQIYSFNATEGGEYYCVATNHLGNERSSGIFLSFEVSSQQFEHWLEICTGVITIIGVGVCICAIVCWRRKKMTDAAVPRLQFENSNESARSTEEEEKEQTLHYGEIQFLKRSPEPSNCRVEFNTVYSQVKVREPASRLRQMADDPECLYAQVRC